MFSFWKYFAMMAEEIWLQTPVVFVMQMSLPSDAKTALIRTSTASNALSKIIPALRFIE